MCLNEFILATNDQLTRLKETVFNKIPTAHFYLFCILPKSNVMGCQATDTPKRTT